MPQGDEIAAIQNFRVVKQVRKSLWRAAESINLANTLKYALK